MLYRKAWQELEKWHASPSRKALLITGARQTGKTTLVREFARERYECFAELNFLENTQASELFSEGLDANSITEGITAYLRVPLKPGNTLVLLDEIQECPAARTAIKFLVEDGRFDYVETGSLLGVKTAQVPSYPVGFERNLQMFPLDFEEFCYAVGVQPQTVDLLRDCFDRVEPVPEPIHQTMLRLFQTYCVVGGMPEVVQRYVETHDIAQVVGLQEDLLALYRLDIEKYADKGDKAKIRSIFDAVPSQLDDSNRRFVLADLSKSARQNRYGSSFLWLADAGVALPCYNVAEPKAPLAGNDKRSLFKLFMGDTGLLCAASMGNAQIELLRGNLEVNMGAIAENGVAQELRAHGFDLHYFNSKREGEVDFVVQNGASALPIEVKSGEGWQRHRALDNVLDVKEWGVRRAIVLCKGNVEQCGVITYLPLYMTMFLAKKRWSGPATFEVDLSALGSA